MTAAADRHLLFGLLALQNGLINQGQLVAAFQAWTLDKSKSLADHLEAGGDLAGARRAALEVLADAHLERHGGDVEKSLAAVPANRSTRESLVALGEPEIEATLARVARRTARPPTPTPTPTTPSEPAALPSARPPPTASGSASCGRTPAAAWARSSSRSTPSSTARSPSSRSSTTPRRRPGQPRAVPARGRDHRRAGAPRHRPGLRPGDLRRRPAVLRDAVHPGRQPQGGDRAIPRRRGAPARPRPPLARAAQAACGGSSTSATPSTTPTAGACSTATSSRATSWSASTARRWWSTGAWPRRWAGVRGVARRRRADADARLGQRQRRRRCPARPWAPPPT